MRKDAKDLRRFPGLGVVKKVEQWQGNGSIAVSRGLVHG